MSNDTSITLVGNLTGDPELRFTQGGVAVVSFTVASTPRTFDKQSNSWKDGETLFLRCSAWREYAENIADSLSKGMRVIVQGRLIQRSWERDGQTRTSYELQVEEVGPALRYAKAQVVRNPQQGQNGAHQFATAANSPTVGEVDPWATQGPQNGTQAPSENSGGFNEPPF